MTLKLYKPKKTFFFENSKVQFTFIRCVTTLTNQRGHRTPNFIQQRQKNLNLD